MMTAGPQDATAGPHDASARRRWLFGLTAAVGLALGVLVLGVAAPIWGSRPLEDVGPPQPGPGGAKDLVYGEDDVVRLQIGRAAEVRDAVPAGDGGLVVLGRAEVGADRVGFVLRLDQDGEPTADFATEGVATLGRWTPGRVAVSADGDVVAVGGARDAIMVWRGDASGRAVEQEQSVTVPVPDGDVAAGVPIDDVTVAPDGTVTIAGGINVNRADDVGGCCAIEPDSIPFRLRLLPSGEPDDAFGPDGFALEALRSGEGGTAGRIPGSAQRDRVSSADADAGRDALGFTAAVTVALPDRSTAVVGSATDEPDRGLVVVARVEP